MKRDRPTRTATLGQSASEQDNSVQEAPEQESHAQRAPSNAPDNGVLEDTAKKPKLSARDPPATPSRTLRPSRKPAASNLQRHDWTPKARPDLQSWIPSRSTPRRPASSKPWDSEVQERLSDQANRLPETHDWSAVPGDDGSYYTYKKTTSGSEEIENERIPDFDELSPEKQSKLIRVVIENEEYETDQYTYVFKAFHVSRMVSALARVPSERPWISFDLEANDLGHKSYPALIQIRDHWENTTYLVDTLALLDLAWDTPAEDGVTTLRAIFEDENVLKLIWDCRQDSCCLFAQLNIKLAGIVDVQILHLLLMDTPPTHRQSLKNGVRDMARISKADLDVWVGSKEKDKGENRWLRRPFTAEEKAYATGDVQYLHDMYRYAETWLTKRGMTLAKELSETQVRETWVEAEDWNSLRSRTQDSIARLWHPSRHGAIRKFGAPTIPLQWYPPRRDNGEGSAY